MRNLRNTATRPNQEPKRLAGYPALWHGRIDVFRIEWLKTNDRRDTRCGNCARPPVMKITLNGLPTEYLCEEHGHEAAERDVLPFPGHRLTVPLALGWTQVNQK
jgi:hypothetical protein